MAKNAITRRSDGPLGERIWWFGQYERIRRVPAFHASSGKTEYWTEFLPTPNCMRHRYELRATWREARHIIADPWGTQA